MLVPYRPKPEIVDPDHPRAVRLKCPEPCGIVFYVVVKDHVWPTHCPFCASQGAPRRTP